MINSISFLGYHKQRDSDDYALEYYYDSSDDESDDDCCNDNKKVDIKIQKKSNCYKISKRICIYSSITGFLCIIILCIKEIYFS